MQTIHKYLDNLRYVGDNVAGDRLGFTLMAARTYPTAKKYLLEKRFFRRANRHPARDPGSRR